MNENKYTIHYYMIKTNRGIEYVAEIFELKGCIGSGKTQEAALQELLENKDIYLEVLFKLRRKEIRRQYTYFHQRKQHSFLIAEKKDDYKK